jgi:hypothetical protein
VLKNVTITVEEEALRWARHQAAEQSTSVSKLVGQMLEREMRNRDSYWQAYEKWKKLKPVRMIRPLPISREETYDRGR